MLAALPLMLSDLIAYARRCALIYIKVLAPSDADPPRVTKAATGRWPSDVQLPSLPAGFMDLLSDLIEASAPNRTGPLIALVKSVQIQHGRARELQDAIQRIDDPVTGDYVFAEDVKDRVIEAADVIARCQRLLPYARGEEPVPIATVSRDDIDKAVFILPTDIDVQMALEQTVERHAERGRWAD